MTAVWVPIAAAPAAEATASAERLEGAEDACEDTERIEDMASSADDFDKFSASNGLVCTTNCLDEFCFRSLVGLTKAVL